MLPSVRCSLALVLLATPLDGQVPEPMAEPVRADTSVRRDSTCDAGRISYVFIDNNSIFDTDDTALDRRFGWVYRTVNALHVTTREWVLRRELLFAPGSCYDPFLLNETERLLRSYSFLSRVDVFGVRQPDGNWHVIVSTSDEWSTVIDVRLGTESGIDLEGVRISEDNLFGTGQSIGAYWFERDVTRDYGIAYFAPQLLGTRWDFTMALGRTRAGTLFHEEVAYPFVAEVSRWAGRHSYRREDRLFDYIIEDDPDLRSPIAILPLREQTFDLSVLRRIGRRGNSALIGAALTYQELSYPGEIEVALDGDFDRREPAPDSIADPIREQRRNLDNIRVFGLLGHRNVWWQQRRGMDSMRGVEDVRLGAEAIIGIGRSISSLEADDDLYTMVTLYAGLGTGGAVVIGRLRADARRDLRAGTDIAEWQDIYLEHEILAYIKSSMMPRHTIVGRAALTGAWHTVTPFQLTIGGLSGVRGFDRERLPGGQRFVATIEDRFFVGWPFPDVLDLGTTVFVDAGRVWPGDVPFGTDSGWRAAAGLGLRGSFPAGSRSTYRVDIAWPIESGARAGDFRIYFSVGETRGLMSQVNDFQLTRSRTQNVGGELFTFRN